MKPLIDIYRELPYGVRRVLKAGHGLIPVRLRLGKEFCRQLDFLNASQWWSEEEMLQYQNEELRRLIEHAYHNVPYYRRLFDRLKLTPRDIRSAGDLHKLPVLTKDIIRRQTAQLRAANIDRKYVVKISTSGTTGKPVSIDYDKRHEFLNFDPFIWRFFGWAGHTLDQKRATLSNWTLEEGETSSYNPVRKTLVLSAYRLNRNNVGRYADVLVKHDIQYVDAYPSMMELLTAYLKEKGIARPKKLNAVFCHSECLYGWQRKLIEEYWDCSCFDWYALEERVILGLESEEHKGLHLSSEFGITEFLESDLPGYQRIVATSLRNYAMPLIRYDTGDMGRLKRDVESKRPFPVLELAGGRKKNFAAAKDGSMIPIANIDIPQVTDNVLQFQFRQGKLGVMDLYLVKGTNFGESDIKKIVHKLDEKFNGNMDVKLHFRRFIPTGKNGKTQLFIQQMKRKMSHGNNGS